MLHTSLKTAVIEPHPILSLGLETLVNRTAALEFRGAWPQAELLEKSCTDWNPDIILLGNYDPTQPVGATINLLNERFPDAAIAVCVNEANRANLETLLQAGARGILGPEIAHQSFNSAIERMTAGITYVSPKVKEAIIESTFRDPASSRSRPKGALSPREQEVLAYVATGKSTRKIALDMDVSFKTVQTLVRRIKIKKGLKTFEELVTYARQSQENQPTKTPA